MNTAQLTLNGGEISPQLHYRLDLEKRGSSLAQCRNFIPLPYGGVRKRPGTYHRTSVSNCTGQEVMQPFQGSDGKRYILIFTPTRFHAWDIAAGTLHTQTIDWPHTTNTLRSLRITAINDILILCSPVHTPVELRYTSATTWALQKIPYTFDPYNDENLDVNSRLTVLSSPVAATWVTATAYTAGTIRLSVDGTREYTCTQSHTSGASTQPGVGSDWTERWTPTRYAPGTNVTIRTHLGRSTWATFTAYAKDQYVVRSGITYRAKSAHNSGDGSVTTPGAELFPGAFWATVTEPFDSLQTLNHVTWTPAAKFRISQRRQDNFFSVSMTATAGNNGNATSPLLIDGDWDFNTFGTWHGKWTLQKSIDNGTTWTTVREWEASGDRNVADTGNETDACLMRIQFTSNGSTPAGGTQRAVFTPRSPLTTSVVSVASYTSATEITASVDTITVSGTTELWTESAFNRRRGFPRCATLHDRRLIFGSTTFRPTSLWLSEIEDFYNFRTGTDDSAAIHLTLAASSQDPILWLASQRKLFIGTAAAEWVVGSETSDLPITPTNFFARPYSTYGSHPSPHILAGDAVLFIQRHANRIREMGYIAERETYDAADLTRLAEHLFYSVDTTEPAPHIDGMSWQQSREPILWVWMSDGTARTFTYIRQERVNAWATMDMAAARIISIAVMPTAADDDSVFFLTLRNGTYYLEEMPPNAQRDSEIGDPGDPAPNRNAPLIYDCQRTESVANAANFPTFSGWTGGKYVRANVSAATTLTEYTPSTANPISGTNTFIGGVPITAELTSLPIEVSTQSGPSLSKKKSITQIRAHAQKARGLQAAQSIASNGAITYTDMQAAYDTFARNAAIVNDSLYYSGWIRANVNLSSLTPCIHLRHIAPAPCTITNIIADVTVTEP